MGEFSRPAGVAIAVAMLFGSNLFMTFAWYWHLRLQKPGASHWPIIAIILVSWLIALVEYIILVPANRIGAAAGLSVAQLKIIQECVSLVVFTVIVALVFKGEPIRRNHIVAFGCIIGAVFFAFLK